MHVHIYVTKACNLRCDHCYYSASDESSEEGTELSMAELHQIICVLYGQHKAVFEVEGGEVFTRKDIPDLLDALPEACLQSMTITTNGTIALDDVTRVLRKLHALRISIEGHTEAIQRQMRHVGLADIVKHGKRLMLADVPVVVRTTLTKTNYAALSDMIAFYADAGFPAVQFFEFQSVGSGAAVASEYSLDEGAAFEIIRGLAALKAHSHWPSVRISLPAARVPLVRRLMPVLNAAGIVIDEPQVDNSLTVDHSGNLGICPWRVSEHAFGNVRGDNWSQILQNVMSAGVLRHTCRHCSAIHLYFNRPVDTSAKE